MPITPTYPGVYIEEIPSGVRTITGVATSITAFIGRTVRGKSDNPVLINNLGDFERVFGGLHVDYPMSYAVNDYFLNGGSQAIIVRLYKSAEEQDGIAKVTVGNLKLQASSAGEWGNKLTVTIDNQGITDEVAERYGLDKAELFNLTVTDDNPNGIVEKILNLSVKEGLRRVDRVLESESQLIRIQLKEDQTPDLPDSISFSDDNASATATGGEKSQALSDLDYQGSKNTKTGLYALDKTDLFNLLCIPPDMRNGDTSKAVYQKAMEYCVSRRAMLIVDPPASWSKDAELTSTAREKLTTDIGLSGKEARNTALYFPRVVQSDPLREGQQDTFVPCGIVAGIMARTDADRGVWKAPAGIDAALNGIQGLAANLTNEENGTLNSLGINCLRTFPVYGQVVWGARTLRGANQLADEYKYIPVRRLALYIEESLYRGTQWVVFEPNDEPLWAQIRLNVGAFMNNLFRQGAFQGSTPQDAYFVKCSSETTTQNDINLGIVNIIVGFAPLKPAEFVIIKFQQIAGQIAA
ncbi:MAG: phage tail sheath family protein [Leptolyngbyaceae cyanobacterium SM1_4_3]|nr:phage tail sheath family protein [Leptolyngbyaceae cyanobacterium SM1_4_3]